MYAMACLAVFCSILIIDVAIHSLTDTCFRKCIPAGTVKNGKLDKYEEPCMRQCVDRFLDANLVVLRELERLRQ
jgi:mitochondrial import inner membrane translocase subunit TIM8